MINIKEFISKNIIDRKQSMFLNDITENKLKLQKHIKNKSVLVIGGAGTIGSSYIKALLPFEPKSLVVWELMFKLPMYTNCQRDNQKNALFLKDRIINIPSGVR